MKVIDIKGASGSSRIEVGNHICDVARLLDGRDAVVVTDDNLEQHYGHLFGELPVLKVGCGEGHKNLKTLDRLVQGLLEIGAHRKTVLLGVGGGIVCDVAGFLASTYMRGIDFGFVSTSLLSMVDASVGGKNGVNSGGYKNIVGTFSQPQFVCCDIALLKTLPTEELCCGFAEIVKHCLIADAEMFEWLDRHADAALALDDAVLQRLVAHSVETKAAVVNRDEKETGERRKLNFGHTVGHALEACGVVSRHGEAVALGMMVSAKLSEQSGLLDDVAVARIECLLEKLSLPTSLSHIGDDVFRAMHSDKKREGASLHAVLLQEIGSAVLRDVPMVEFEAAVRSLV